MGRLIVAEYRKLLSTKLWWALLIPAALLSLGFSWGGAALGALGEIQEDAGGFIPLALPAFAQGINFATVFAVILGATAVTGEMRHKTITTSYLTSNSRGAVLAAKSFVYSTVGAVYGVVCMAAATLGATFGGNLPDLGAWFTLAAAGILAMVLWTLLGVGVGALIGNQVGAVVGLIVYVLIVEPVLSAVLRFNDVKAIPPYLVNGSGSGMVNDLALDLFVEGLPGSLARNREAMEEVRGFLNLDGAPPWWGSMLIFVAWAAVLGTAGWAVARRRDIT